MAKLKNATSQSVHTFDKIQKILAEHNAQRIIFDYDQQGKIHAIFFSMEINGNIRSFKLPARLENVSRVMYGCLLSGLGGGYMGEKNVNKFIEQRGQIFVIGWMPKWPCLLLNKLKWKKYFCHIW